MTQVKEPFFIVSQEEHADLMKMVPRMNPLDQYQYLPSEPPDLTPRQESTLYKLINNDLHDGEPPTLGDLQRVRLAASWGQPPLTNAQHLGRVLSENKVNLSTDTFKLLLPLSVERGRWGAINAEIFVNHLKTGLNYRTERYNSRIGSATRDIELSKLMKMVSDRMADTNYSVNYDDWLEKFKRFRSSGEFLNGARIRDVCYHQRLPLDGRTIDDILEVVGDTNRDGVFRWRPFLNFLKTAEPPKKIQGNYNTHGRGSTGPWLDRYFKMAEAFYHADYQRKGTLPIEKVKELLINYNRDLDLQMNTARLIAFLDGDLPNWPPPVDKYGEILLPPFLLTVADMERIKQ